MGGERERAWRGRRATGRQIRCRTKAFFHYPPVLPPAEQSLRQRGRPTVPAANFPLSLSLFVSVCPPLYILTIFAVCGGWSATKPIQALFKMGKPAQTSIFTSRAPRGKLDIVQFLDWTRARFPSCLSLANHFCTTDSSAGPHARSAHSLANFHTISPLCLPLSLSRICIVLSLSSSFVIAKVEAFHDATKCRWRW